VIDKRIPGLWHGDLKHQQHMPHALRIVDLSANGRLFDEPCHNQQPKSALHLPTSLSTIRQIAQQSKTRHDEVYHVNSARLEDKEKTYPLRKDCVCYHC